MTLEIDIACYNNPVVLELIIDYWLSLGSSSFPHHVDFSLTFSGTSIIAEFCSLPWTTPILECLNGIFFFTRNFCSNVSDVSLEEGPLYSLLEDTFVIPRKNNLSTSQSKLTCCKIYCISVSLSDTLSCYKMYVFLCTFVYTLIFPTCKSIEMY